MSQLLSVPEEVEIRRAAYIAVVRGELRARWTHGQFAARLRTARGYIQQLLREIGGRSPGKQLADSIVSAFAFDDDRRQDLLRQMQMATERRLTSYRAVLKTTMSMPYATLLGEMQDAHRTATSEAHLRLVGPSYQAVASTADRFLEWDRPLHDREAAIEVCLLLQNALNVLNRPAEALVHAKAANRLAGRLGVFGSIHRRELVARLQVDAWLAEADRLVELGLAKQAERVLDRGMTGAAFAEASAPWLDARIALSRLAALSERSRFSLYRADDLANAARLGWGDDQRASVRIDVALARAYLRYGSELSGRKAARLLRPAIESLDRIPSLGALDRTLAMRTFADACQAVGLRDEAVHYATRAWLIADQAGLTRQIASMRRQHGVEWINALAETG